MASRSRGQMTHPTIQSSQAVESENRDLDKLRIELIQNYLNGSLILGTILFFINLYISVQQNDAFSAITTVILFGLLFAITFLRRIEPGLRTFLLSLTFFGTGVFSLLSSGLNANGMLYFFIAVLVLGLLGTRSWWITGLVFSGITTLVIGILIQSNVIRHGISVVEINSITYWITTSVILLFLIYVILSPTNRYLLQMIKLLQYSHNEELSLQYDNTIIADRVRAMEHDLDRRRSHLISGRQIIRSISETLKTKDLMQDAADLIKSQFGYYFVGIYLSDINKENAVLHAATGAAGKALLSRNHTVRLREGIIGFVVSRGESRIALDVDVDILHLKNPDLPETKSEITIPLKIGSRVIGALDVQSDKVNAFSQDDSDILQTIADQLAIMIEKTRQIETLQTSLSELEGAYSAYSQSSWRSHLRGSRKTLSYRYTGSSLEKNENLDTRSLDAIQTSTKLIVNEDGSESTSPVATLAMPILLRNQALGVLNIKYNGKSIPKELEEMVEITSSRLAVALENARLLEDIQDRADRERVVGSIANKVRTARDIDSILQTTAAELGRSLGVNEVRIQLKTQENEQ